MSDDNNNGRVPIKIVQLLIEKMEVGFQNSQEKISKETEELTDAIVSLINKMNASNELLVGKLNLIKNKISKMVLVVTVAFSMLMGAVALSIFGAHLLYERNVKIFKGEISEKEDKRNIEMSKEIKDGLKDIIKEYIDELNKEKPIKK